MPEQSLDELRQLSLPALRHAELVNLARTESPNKAYELASVRWPRRQAKATRFLAMVRRDHGPEALEAFIMEHARPNGSEHAQGGDEMKFETMYPEGVRGVVFVHNFHGPNDPNTLHLRHFTGEGHRDVNLREEINRFQLDEAQTKVLVRRVLQAMLDQWATPKVQQFFYGSMWGSALLVARTYLSEDRELLKKLLLAAVVYEGGHEKHVNGLVHAILPNPTNESVLQDVINYLLESGCTEEEVRTAWTEMLRTRQRDRFKTVCITEWWKGLKVGEYDLKKEAEPIARQLLLYELNDILVNGCFDWNNPNYTKNGRAPEDFMEVVDFLLFQTDYDWHSRNEETRELVESYFVQCVARGKVGTAHYMLVRYGKWFSFWNEYASKSDEMPNAAMERLMRAAVEKAEESRSYGTATALAEYIGETETADRFREMARSLKQRVALDHAFYHAVDMHK